MKKLKNLNKTLAALMAAITLQCGVTNGYFKSSAKTPDDILVDNPYDKIKIPNILIDNPYNTPDYPLKTLSDFEKETSPCDPSNDPCYQYPLYVDKPVTNNDTPMLPPPLPLEEPCENPYKDIVDTTKMGENINSKTGASETTVAIIAALLLIKVAASLGHKTIKGMYNFVARTIPNRISNLFAWYHS